MKWTKTKISQGVYTIKSIEQAEQLLMAQFTVVLAFIDSLKVHINCSVPLFAKGLSILNFINSHGKSSTFCSLNSYQGPDSEELAAASKLHTDVIFYQAISADVAKAFQFEQEIESPALILREKESQHLSHFS